MSTRIAERTRAAELLLDCLHGDPHRLREESLARLDADGWRELIDVAHRVGVAELLYERLLARGRAEMLPPAVRAELIDHCHRIAAAGARTLDELARVLAALRRGGVEAIWLKGVGLALEIYGHLAWRRPGDIDLLVRSADLERAAAVLVSDGYSPERPYSAEAVIRSTHHLPPFSAPGRTSVDLHWTILPPSSGYDVPPHELWARATTGSVGEVDALGLPPEHQLLHQCVHASYRHLFATGLRPVCDIAGLVERHRSELDWVEVVDSARRWRVAPGAYLALRVASDLVGAGVPQPVLDELGGAEPGVVAAGREQMLSVVAPLEQAEMSVHLPRVLRGRGAAGRLAILARRLLPPRADLATEYGVDVRSPRVYPYYLVRAKDLIARHWRYLPAYLGLGRDGGAAAFARRQGRLATWLAAEGGEGSWR